METGAGLVKDVQGKQPSTMHPDTTPGALQGWFSGSCRRLIIPETPTSRHTDIRPSVYEIEESCWLHLCSQEGGWQTSLAAGACGPWWRGKPALQVGSLGVGENWLRMPPEWHLLAWLDRKAALATVPFFLVSSTSVSVLSPPTSSIGNRDGFLQPGQFRGGEEPCPEALLTGLHPRH